MFYRWTVTLAFQAPAAASEHSKLHNMHIAAAALQRFQKGQCAFGTCSNEVWGEEIFENMAK